MTRALCWRDQHGATRRTLMTVRAAERFAAIMTAIFPGWPCWTEAAQPQGGDA